MRILILANNDVGLYKFRKELIQELIRQGNRVIVSLPDGELIPDIRKLGVKVILTDVDRRGINPLTDLKLLMRYFRMAVTLKPNLVITYTIKPNVYGGMVSRFLHIPYAENITGLGTTFQTENLVKKLVCFLYKVSSKCAKVVFFENEENKQIFLDNHLIREEQACRLNGAGVNLDEYPYMEYPGENEPIRFLFIGRVMKEKGVDELFEAARRIKKEYPDVLFDIVGPMEDEYSSVITKLEEDGIITYYGYQKDVRPFIARCHCFVLPSWHEGMANTLLEAGAMGRPLITSRIHGCMEAVVDGESGYLAEKGNEESLIQKFHNFFELERDEQENMGRKSRKYIEQFFDKVEIVNDTIGALK
ncbi:glycosyltransferase family 4 protein [Lachnoclostridium sp. An118]|uniref:glycosyltransferase family 4 protein n=1 Tax=Lachnoclostridium sp. An118 TaxID=1965547 RepID=UPI000B392882|nr:glycosyltransferase family 4 protein [Lachnoclostridium sp. An118]OUQ47360.1 glycosyltransferase family 1 protein [Lachnoclostridium sp. An118]